MDFESEYHHHIKNTCHKSFFLNHQCLNTTALIIARSYEAESLECTLHNEWKDFLLSSLDRFDFNKASCKKKTVHEEKSQAHFSFCSKSCTNTTMHSALLECVIIITDQSWFSSYRTSNIFNVAAFFKYTYNNKC